MSKNSPNGMKWPHLVTLVERSQVLTRSERNFAPMMSFRWRHKVTLLGLDNETHLRVIHVLGHIARDDLLRLEVSDEVEQLWEAAVRRVAHPVEVAALALDRRIVAWLRQPVLEKEFKTSEPIQGQQFPNDLLIILQSRWKRQNEVASTRF